MNILSILAPGACVKRFRAVGFRYLRHCLSPGRRKAPGFRGGAGGTVSPARHPGCRTAPGRPG